ncbi:MAG: hypothetical protein EAZ89_11845 [Bacteroidetes bacterium]|nr:MAG: hypothetical protein EAZ89_11845 [Bacteroidota bacterium]
MLNRLLFLFLTLSSTGVLWAQRSFSLYAGPALPLYYGDLSDQFHLRTLRGGAHLGGSAYLLPGISVRLGFTGGVLTGADSLADAKPRQDRNLSFRTPLAEGSVQLVWEWFPDRRYGKGWKNRPHFSPYLFAGIAGFAFQPQAKLADRWYDLQPLGTEGQFIHNGGYPAPYKLVQAAFPVGGGLSYRFERTFGVQLEVGYRTLFTDYLDDVSNIYPDAEKLRQTSGPVAAALANRSNGIFADAEKRGNASVDDSYIVVSCALVYYLPKKRR